MFLTISSLICFCITTATVRQFLNWSQIQLSTSTWDNTLEILRNVRLLYVRIFLFLFLFLYLLSFSIDFKPQGILRHADRLFDIFSAVGSLTFYGQSRRGNNSLFIFNVKCVLHSSYQYLLNFKSADWNSIIVTA